MKIKKIIILENIKSNELSLVFSKIVSKGLCCDKVWGSSIFPSCTLIRGIYRKSLLDGTFYEPELQKIIKNNYVYRVEKILRKRKRKGVVEYLVRWKGYENPKFDSWIQERDILKS